MTNYFINEPVLPPLKSEKPTFRVQKKLCICTLPCRQCVLQQGKTDQFTNAKQLVENNAFDSGVLYQDWPYVCWNSTHPITCSAQASCHPVTIERMKTIKLTTFFAQLSVYYDSRNMLHIYAQHCLQCTLFAFGRQSSVMAICRLVLQSNEWPLMNWMMNWICL